MQYEYILKYLRPKKTFKDYQNLSLCNEFAMSQGGIAARTLTLMRGSKKKKKQNTPRSARIVPDCYDRHTHAP